MRSNFVIAPLLAFAGALGAFAQTTQKIAVIDMQSAMLGTRDGQKAVAELKARFTPREQELQKRQKELQDKQDQYRKTENNISDEAKNTLSREIDTLQRGLQRDSEDANQDLQQEQQRILGDLSQKMNQVLNKYAADKQISMIFDVSGQPNNILFATTSTDITRDIIALYDSANAVTPPAPPAKPTTSAPAPAAAPKPAAAQPAAAPKPPAATTPK
ncbi:MAG TPA: OmpH family outer membrane protein [Bryobacteraceae bacterium]|nr:OmpH family outer membrane protein [Bryobacteraceae bacterium]